MYRVLSTNFNTSFSEFYTYLRRMLGFSHINIRIKIRINANHDRTENK